MPDIIKFKSPAIAMRRFAAFILTLVALVWCHLASAQMPMTGAGLGSPKPSTPPTITYIGLSSGPSGAGTSTYTWTGVSLGTGGANRRIFFAFAFVNNTSVTSATIDGVACDVISTFGSADSNSIILITAPTHNSDTTGTVVVNFSGGAFEGSGGLVWNLANDSLLSSTTPVTNYVAGGSTSAVATVNTLSGGFLIAVFNNFGLSGPSLSSSSPTITVDNTPLGGGHANGLSSGTATATWSYTGGPSGSLLLAAYR
jgi:hypothetical protein